MNSSKCFLLVAIFVLFSAGFASARGVTDYDAAALSYYVAASGNDANNGLTEQNAFKTFAKAMELVTASNIKHITIVGVLNEDSESPGRGDSVFSITNSGKHEIIIAGKPGSSAELRGGNGKRVINILGNSCIRFENILISGGETEDQGGGIFSDNGSSITLAAGAVVTDNISSEGGGVYIHMGALTLLDDATIIDNTVSTDEGGGAVVVSSIFVMADNSQISGNSGGGLVLLESEGIVKDNASIAYNYCDYSGGGVFAFMSDLSVGGSSRVLGNKAGQSGGGIWLGGGNLLIFDEAAIRENETGGNGGGISMDDSSLTIQGYAEINGNKAGENGGGIYSQGGYVILDEYTKLSYNESPSGGGLRLVNLASAMIRGNVEVSGNLALGSQGGGGFCATAHSAIHMTGGEIKSNASTRGGGVYIDEASFILDGGYIMDNWAELGGGIYAMDESLLKVNDRGSLVEDNNPDNIKEQ